MSISKGICNISPKNKQAIIYSFVIISAILLALMSFYTCRIADDLYYAKTYSGYIYRGEAFPGFAPAWDFIQEHWANVNGRTGDKLIAVFLAIPDWIVSIIAFLTSIITFKYLSLLAYGKDWSTRLGSIAICALYVLVIPWYDSSFLKCMLINYQMSLAISLVWIWYFINPPKYNVRNITLIIILSLFAGSWHEQFSMLLVPAIVLGLFIIRNKMKLQWIAVISFLVGVTLILISPGFWRRLGYEFVSYDINWLLFIAKGSISLPLPIVCLCFLYKQFLRKDKEIGFSIKEWLFFIFTASVICGTIYLNFKLNCAYYRVWWFALSLSISGWAIVFRYLKLHKIPKYSIIGGLLIISLLNLSVSVYWQRLIKKEFDTVIELFLESENGVVYYDSEVPFDIPWVTLRKPERNPYMRSFFAYTPNVREDKKYLYLLPTELKDIETLKLRSIKDAPDYFLTPQGYLLHRDSTINIPYTTTLSYLDVSGEMKTKVCQTIRLAASRDSLLAFIWPHTHMYESENDIVLPLSNIAVY